MKELVEVIANALVDNPDEVVVTETENGQEDTGRYPVIRKRSVPHVVLVFKTNGNILAGRRLKRTSAM